MLPEIRRVLQNRNSQRSPGQLTSFHSIFKNLSLISLENDPYTKIHGIPGHVMKTFLTRSERCWASSLQLGFLTKMSFVWNFKFRNADNWIEMSQNSNCIKNHFNGIEKWNTGDKNRQINRLIKISFRFYNCILRCHVINRIQSAFGTQIFVLWMRSKISTVIKFWVVFAVRKWIYCQKVLTFLFPGQQI